MIAPTTIEIEKAIESAANVETKGGEKTKITIKPSKGYRVLFWGSLVLRAMLDPS